MLDPWIIDEILKREEDRRREQERARIEAPLQSPPRYKDSGEYPAAPAPASDEGERGVTIIDI
jgi:hypothetical protein